ncbi:hypothetical protein BC831DRAFT_22919 [Entophlyctis helioformis]|nr:hypothetical protein BC831DRAFT_22919 [Entophlyctis helioformis]
MDGDDCYESADEWIDEEDAINTSTDTDNNESAHVPLSDMDDELDLYDKEFPTLSTAMTVGPASIDDSRHRNTARDHSSMEACPNDQDSLAKSLSHVDDSPAGGSVAVSRTPSKKVSSSAIQSTQADHAGHDSEQDNGSDSSSLSNASLDTDDSSITVGVPDSTDNKADERPALADPAAPAFICIALNKFVTSTKDINLVVAEIESFFSKHGCIRHLTISIHRSQCIVILQSKRGMVDQAFKSLWQRVKSGDWVLGGQGITIEPTPMHEALRRATSLSRESTTLVHINDLPSNERQEPECPPSKALSQAPAPSRKSMRPWTRTTARPMQVARPDCSQQNQERRHCRRNRALQCALCGAWQRA